MLRSVYFSAIPKRSFPKGALRAAALPRPSAVPSDRQARRGGRVYGAASPQAALTNGRRRAGAREGVTRGVWRPSTSACQRGSQPRLKPRTPQVNICFAPLCRQEAGPGARGGTRRKGRLCPGRPRARGAARCSAPPLRPQPVAALGTVLVRSPNGRWAPEKRFRGVRLSAWVRTVSCGEKNLNLESENMVGGRAQEGTGGAGRRGAGGTAGKARAAGSGLAPGARRGRSVGGQPRLAGQSGTPAPEPGGPTRPGHRHLPPRHR